MSFQSDVLIIGCGPTGVVLANLLAQAGVHVRIIEKDPGIYPICRATHIDEETLRNFQLTGLMPRLKTAYSPFGCVDVVDEKGIVLLQEDNRQQGSEHGYASSAFFDQPAFEAVLRQGLHAYPELVLHSGIEALSFKQDPDQVYVKGCSQSTQEELVFQAKWVIGCDGGRSICREQLEIEMNSLAPRRQWMVVDTLLKDPADAVLLPDGFRYVLHPEHLTIYAHGFGLNRRWEFQLAEGEVLPDQQTLNHWLQPFIDPAKLEILRMVKYAHHSLVANQWRQGRILLAGDAAHMMPPSAGQGMCSGVRDAVNLAWKLVHVIQEHAPASLLDSYQSERKPHVEAILKGAIFINNRLQADHPIEQWLRKAQLTLIGKIPLLQDILRQLSFRRNPLQSGCLQDSCELAGHHLPQFAAAEAGAGSDDQLGYAWNLISKNPLSSKLAADCQSLGIRVLELSDLSQSYQAGFKRFLNPYDYVLVRPDKIIYSIGRKNQLLPALEQLQAQLKSPLLV